MSPRAALFVPLVPLVALACTACSRGEERPTTMTLGGRNTVRPTASAATGEPPPPAPPRDEPWPGDVPATRGGKGFQMMVTRTVVTEAGAPAPKSNPDDAVLERARVAAGGCFSSLSVVPGVGPSERNAHIVYTVIPTGTVSTADVSSPDTTDDRVLNCLRQQALSTTFSDNGGGPLRTYEIDVQVIAKTGAGGR